MFHFHNHWQFHILVEISESSACSMARPPLKLSIKFLLLFVLSLSCRALNKPDIEGAALAVFLTALNDTNKKLDWDTHFVSPCFSWAHVTCLDGRVVSLSLASNGFTGTLSPAIAELKYLVTLDLQNNSLSGSLPDSLSSMSSLQNLNLAHNNFSGSIPASWGLFPNLKHLVMRENRLNGSIPESLVNITGLMELDLSSNDHLIGKIPQQLFSLPTFNYTSTQLTCGDHVHWPCLSRSSNPVSKRRSRIQVAVTVTSVSVFCILLLGAVFRYQFLRAHKHKHDIFIDVSGEDESKVSLGQIRRFSLREMQLATGNFSECNIIGQGGYGKVYRGVLSDSTTVAIKRLMDHHNPGGEAAFQREVELISVAVHRNLLRLIGFCTTWTERILVYPFMQNLSVAYRLRELKPGEKGLDWPTRKRIAIGAAHGLEYLHEHCNPKIIHRDMKAANILLTDDLEAVLGDFGLAKLMDTKVTHVTTQVRGTMGHIAPEYLSTGKSSEKTDVFGFGITLLELVTGQRAIDLSRLEEEEDVLLLDHIKKLLREKRLEDIIDRNLKKCFDREEVESILQVAMVCTHNSPEDRPTMAEVGKMLVQGVGLSERWAAWEQLEQLRAQEYSLMSRNFLWAEEFSNDQHAIQLSQAR